MMMIMIIIISIIVAIVSSWPSTSLNIKIASHIVVLASSAVGYPPTVINNHECQMVACLVKFLR